MSAPLSLQKRLLERFRMDIRADGQIPYLPLHVLLTGIVKSMIETTGLENSLVRNDGPP